MKNKKDNTEELKKSIIRYQDKYTKSHNHNIKKEIERYGIMANYFDDYPSRLTRTNQNNLEDVFDRLLNIRREIRFKRNKRVDNYCLKVLESLSTKLDFRAY